MTDNRCGCCKHRKVFEGELCCCNEDSVNYSLEVDYTDKCDDFEAKNDDNYFSSDRRGMRRRKDV